MVDVRELDVDGDGDGDFDDKGEIGTDKIVGIDEGTGGNCGSLNI